ncbi:MAG: hypothetical protein QW273_01135 [Candidatus Pacearchaeota archaeon]
MEQKNYFKTKSIEEILSFKSKRVYSPKNLISRILELEEDSSLHLYFPIIPFSFLKAGRSSFSSSRKNYKHGEYLEIYQPRTLEESFKVSDSYIPLHGRMKSFEELHKLGLKEEEINILGLKWHPINGMERVPRLVPFDSVLEAVKIYNYSVNIGTGIEINAKYINSKIVREEGAQILFKVPSRSIKREKYSLKLLHVPIIDSKEAISVVLRMKPEFNIREPERDFYLHNLRYSFVGSDSERVVFGPHSIAAYLYLIRESWEGFDKTVPLKMNPFPLPSKRLFDFYEKINNNLLIYDPTKKSLRKLYIDEKSILIGRAIHREGAWEMAYWDYNRDGKLSEYKKE